MNKAQIFTNLREFLTKQQNNSLLKKTDYRLFFGNIRGSLEWVKRKELTENELTTIKKIKTLLDTWQNNYNGKQLGISLEVLTGLNNELSELLVKFQENKPKSQQSKPPQDNPLFDNVNEKLTQAEEGFKWLSWYENNKGIIKGVGIVFIILFAWLVIRAIKEELC